MKASSHKPESMKDCNKILPPSTRSDCIFSDIILPLFAAGYLC